MSTSRLKWMPWALLACVAVLAVATRTAMADEIESAHYDPTGDQLVITVLYDGTNPHHHFAIRWGRCRRSRAQLHGPAGRIIAAALVDAQGNDVATRPYTEVIKVPLAGLHCRPATVMVWTLPRTSFVTVKIP